MKKTNRFWQLAILLLFASILFTDTTKAQDSRDKRLIDDAEKAKSNFTAGNTQIQEIFDKAYGYAILPNVGKGAAGIGAAAGSGIVYEKGKMVGIVKMRQLTAGLQIGGQSYREIIFFEDKNALDRFKSYSYEFSSETSAVAMNDANDNGFEYNNGIIVFTQKKTGLMYDASVGGQKFDYNSF